MQKVLIIAGHEYLVNVRRPDFIIITLLIPLLGLAALIIGAFFGGQAGSALEGAFDSEPPTLGPRRSVRQVHVDSAAISSGIYPL